MQYLHEGSSLGRDIIYGDETPVHKERNQAAARKLREVSGLGPSSASEVIIPPGTVARRVRPPKRIRG